MAKRVLVIAAGVLYLASFAAGAVVYFLVEGSFSPGSRYFLAYTALPVPILLAHLAAGVLMLRWWRRALPAVLSVEVMVFVAALAGLGLFWTTFRWVAPLAVLRAAFAGVMIGYLWFPLQGDRRLVAAGAAAGLVLGLVWPLTLVPPGDGCRPALGDRLAPEVWSKSAGGRDLDVQVWAGPMSLPAGGKLFVRPNAQSVDLQFGKTVLSVIIVPTLRRVSMDGFWSTTLNTVGLSFRIGGSTTSWEEEGRRYWRVNYASPECVASRFARNESLRKIRRGIATVDVYTKVDTSAETVDIVALLHLAEPLYVSDMALFEARFQPCQGQRIRLGGLADWVLPGSQGEAGPPDRSARLVNVEDGRTAVYRCPGGLGGTLDEVARSEHFGDWLVIEDVAPGIAVLLYAPDWRGQALPAVSPSAGRPLGANALDLEVLTLSRAEAAKTGWSDYVSVSASIAGSEAGRGRPAVRMDRGTYVNRMAIRVVPKAKDYGPAVQAIRLWQFPGETASGR